MDIIYFVFFTLAYLLTGFVIAKASLQWLVHGHWRYAEFLLFPVNFWDEHTHENGILVDSLKLIYSLNTDKNPRVIASYILLTMLIWPVRLVWAVPINFFFIFSYICIFLCTTSVELVARCKKCVSV